MISKILDYIESYLHRKEYEKNIKISKVTSIVTKLLSNSIDPNTERTRHPFHNKRLEEYKGMLGYWLDGREININFGDSLTDMARTQIKLCHDGIFSISGSWSHHMQMMAEDLHKDLSRFVIKNISIGCLGGNPLLVHQNYETVVKEAIECLNKVRELYPDSRIIVYGLPPVYNIHVTENTYQFDNELLQWTLKDKDAKFINLKARFGKGFARLFPQVEYSSDGVHFNPRGAGEFSTLIAKEQR